jgi:hypothetical protein
MMAEVQSRPTDLLAGRRIDFAVRTCLGRPPTATETSALIGLYERMLERYRDNPAAAAKLIGSPTSADTTVEQLAACVAVARTLINLDEFITRE